MPWLDSTGAADTPLVTRTPLGRASPGRASASGDGEALRDELGELHRVERGALGEVVVADEQREPAPLGHALVLADAADVARVGARRLERSGDVRQSDA